MQTILVLMLVLLARGAVAQELPPTLRPLAFTFTADRAARPVRPARDPFDYAVFTYGATAGADWALTSVCLKIDCTPEDPIGLAVTADNPKVAVPLALALDVAIVYSVKQWIKPRHPALAQAVLYLLSTVRLIIITHRISDLRKNGATTP